MSRFIVALVVVTTFCLFAFSENNQGSPFDVSYAQSGIQWSVFVPASRSVLTVSGPDGYYWKQEYGPNSRPQLRVVDEQGVPLPEGLYRWELVAQLPPGAGGEVPDEPNPVISGSFIISGGSIVPRPDDAQPALVEEGAPPRSLFLDRAGRLGVGTTVPQTQLHLKGSSPALTLEDTTTGGRVFTLRGLEKGDGSLGLFDQATGEARWLVDGEGRVGINTTQPSSTLTVDGYIETTKGFLVNGRPVGIGFGLIGGSQPLYVEDPGKAIFGSNAGAVNTALNVAFFGTNAGAANTTGAYNSFFGQAAGFDNTTGQYNSFFGMQAGNHNTSSSHNSAFGYRAGFTNATGPDNAFFGSEAGYNTTAYSNSFFGRSAGRSNTTGPYNSFFGFEAGYSNTSAVANSFFGDRAGRANTGGLNSFFGASAGSSNTIGAGNNFFGVGSGGNNTEGSSNAFFGSQSGGSNTVENGNTFIGASSNGAAGITNATALGYRAGVTQANSLVLGSIPGVNTATSYVNVGIGTTTPARQLHVAGPNAVFRMDRSTDTASFILVRTDATGNTPWKTFVVGTNATGVNQGEFIINDIGAAVGGGGNRRMTIQNDGNVVFTGTVTALDFASPSSLALKTNVRTLENAVETVNRLRGVRFSWKESGNPAVGLIAEEVDEVVPEVVAHEGGKAKGVNYASLVAVLVEAVKEQQATIQEERKANQRERRRNEEQQQTIEKLERQQEELTGLKAEIDRLKLLLQER